MSEKSLWLKEIDEAEQGYPNDHFFEDVRYLTTLVSSLYDMLDQVAPDSIDEDLAESIKWYFADKPAIKNSGGKCVCPIDLVINKGCECGGT